MSRCNYCAQYGVYLQLNYLEMRKLTFEEQDMVRLRLTGISIDKVARALRRKSKDTVKNQFHRIYEKLGVMDSLEMVNVLLLPRDHPLRIRNWD